MKLFARTRPIVVARVAVVGVAVAAVVIVAVKVSARVASVASPRRGTYKACHNNAPHYAACPLLPACLPASCVLPFRSSARFMLNHSN